jgi:hypothetical protein
MHIRGRRKRKRKRKNIFYGNARFIQKKKREKNVVLVTLIKTFAVTTTTKQKGITFFSSYTVKCSKDV